MQSACLKGANSRDDKELPTEATYKVNPAKTSAPINVTTANTIRARKNLAMLEQRPQGYFVRNPS